MTGFLYDFAGAQFDLERDRAPLAWLVSQLSFGSLIAMRAARAARRDPSDFEANVKVYGRVLRDLTEEPQPPHPVLRAWGMIASRAANVEIIESTWMLSSVGALAETIPPSLPSTLLSAIDARRPANAPLTSGPAQERKQVAGLALAAQAAADRVAAFGARTFAQHPVIARLPELSRFAGEEAAVQLRRAGVIHDTLGAFTPIERILLIGESAARTALRLR